ncbi:MAG TPA: NAD(+) synthase [Candidatus Binatia bacterium]
MRGARGASRGTSSDAARSESSPFLDVRKHGFARVAVCVPRVRVADPAFNADAHLAELEKVYDAGAHYALFPELGLSGYTCGDLFFQETLLREVRDALARMLDASADWNVAASVGLPLVVDDLVFNCAVTFRRGRVLAVVPKSYPPNYREFYEGRWFHAAAEARSREVELLGQTVPFGTDVLVRLPDLPHFVLHTDVCEDLWVPVPPSTLAALAGATVLANLSASNITVGKWEFRRELVTSSAARNIAVQMYSAAGFGESTADLAWDGHGLIAERGVLIGETERFRTDGGSVVVDVDLEAVVQDRMRQTSFGQNRRALGGEFRCVESEAAREARDVRVFETLNRAVDPHPFVPSDPARRDHRCREVFLIQATSLARRLESLPEHARRVTVGVSGGQDSTHALLVAAHALDLLGLERSRITGVTMPGFGTTERTRRNAHRLIEALGATHREIPIVDLSESVFAAIGHPPEQENVTFENVQAWLRKLLLFASTSQTGGIDLGTGDLSEIALGFATYGGDHMSHYAVNSGVPKTLITFLIRWASEVVFRDEPGVQEVLQDVIATPISPELLRPSPTGEIKQRTEDIVGPYELHDFFLYHLLRFGSGPRRIARLAHHAFAGRYELAEIRRWLIVFVQRFFASQFKRDCMPDGPKVGSGGALSPRGDWRMPPDASPDAWLAEARSLPERVVAARGAVPRVQARAAAARRRAARS